MKYKHLLFDADNTLFDFNRCEAEAFKLAIESSELTYSEELYGKYHVINDGLWKDLEKGLTTRSELKVLRYKRLFEAEGITDGDYKTLALNYENFLGMQSFEIKGAYELLESLSGKFGIYVITNGITSIQKHRFSLSRLTAFVDKIFISEEMGVSKPAREFFSKVIADIGDADVRNYLVIGDSLTSDIDGAISSGIDSCWFDLFGGNADGREPTYTVNKLSGINSIVF